MPSQNLPKPNLPGQTSPNTAPVSPVPPVQPASNPQVNQTANPQTVFSQAPVQTQAPTQVKVASQAQVIPGGLSRENPGGTPPNMRVSAPTPPPTINPVSVATSTQSKLPPVPNRPTGPLDQISLNTKPATPSVASTNPVAQMASNPQVAQTNQVTSNQPMAPTKPSGPEIAQVSNNPAQPSAPNQVKVEATQISEDKKDNKPLAKFKLKLPKPLLIGGAVILVLAVAFLLFNLFKPKSSTPSKSTSTNQNSNVATKTTPTEVTTLTYWGLWEDSQILKEVIADFESKNPGIKIDYRKQSHRDYRERLQQAIASGNGPDIFRYHMTWVPMLSTDLAPLPTTVMSAAEYKQTFYPTAANNLQVGGQIVGIPLMYDGLALFYNKEMLKTANLSVPTTWAELRTAANKLTVPANLADRQNGNITRAGLAIGNAGNVDHFSDILGLLIIQNGGNPSEVSSQYVKDAITFYTNFIRQDKVWSDRLANSTTAFARGDVAMIFAPSWRVHDIKNLNPNLDFAVARLPQLDAENPIAWATFWAEGVNNKSKNKDAAWLFLKHLSSAEVLRKFYNDASQYRAFGEIYPRIDMGSELQSNELVGAYIEDAPIAKSWYMASFTHDNGINDQVIKYYEDAVNAVLTGSGVEKALEPAASGITSVLSKYNFSK